MNIAIPVYENRVMPRFGCTRQLLIVHVKDREIVEQHQLMLTDEQFGMLPEILASEQVTLMICGGIHPRFQQMFRQQQIEVIWGIRGEWQHAVQAYLTGTLPSTPQYCRGNRQHHGFHGHRTY